jgi:universal stress protein E
MAKPLRRILVTIRDLRHLPKSELSKAGALAKAAGASVELFHVIDEPDPGRSYPETTTREAVAGRCASVLASSRGRLEKFGRDTSLRGMRIICTVAWDFPPHEAIVRRALTTHADLVIAAAHGHRPGARLLLANTDWELIRHCPVPLLLVKSRRPWDRPAVLAAVDPSHARAPVTLDKDLLRLGSALAQLLHGRLHVFHAYSPLIVEPPGVSAAPLIMMEYEREIGSTIRALAASIGVPPARCHVSMGDVTAELRALARRTHASLVVMGAVSRSALGRVFIGNTAERVLDSLGCDVLVVKPRGFRFKVRRGRPIALTSGPGGVTSAPRRVRSHR